MKNMSTTRKTLRYFWAHTKPYKFLFWVATVGAALGVICQDIIGPLIVAKTFSKLQVAYAMHTGLQLVAFVPYFLLFSLFMILGLVIWRIQGYAAWLFEIKAERDIAVDVYNHLQNQSQRFHADRFGGALVSQTNKFMHAYERLMDEFLWSIMTGFTALFVSMGVLFFVTWKYAMVLAIIVSLYMFIMTMRMRKQLPFNRLQAAKESELTAVLADKITNMGTVRAFANEDYELKHFADAADENRTAYLRLASEVMKSDVISHSQTNSFHIIALLFGLVAITHFNANASVLYLVIAYTQGIVNRLWLFSRVTRNINQAFGDATEMTKILDIKPEISDPENPIKAHIHRGSIEFTAVHFAYPENLAKPLFRDLDVRIKPGEKVGLVGHSGGGKTTITRLLLRFMDIQSGQIQIDGQNIRDMKQSDLRRHIASVPQEPLLFHRSIMENIRYGNQSASEKEVLAVSKLAHAHEFITKLPNGYDTLVGERGVKLSGGQRQRVAIARAMLKNAPILVLDEATSALDSESEALIQDALWRLMEGRTAIVIAHRLSTIQKMDRILVLEKGKIVEQGTHKELIRQNGTYAGLWNHQTGGFLEE